MNADGGDQAGRQHEPADQGIAYRGQNMQHSERHDRHLAVDPLASNGLELSHKIGWQPDHEEVSVVKSLSSEWATPLTSENSRRWRVGEAGGGQRNSVT